MSLTLTREVVSYALARLDRPAQLQEVLRFADPGACTFTVEAAESLADVLEALQLSNTEQTTLIDAWRDTVSPLGLYLTARIRARLAEPEAALDFLTRCMASLPTPEPSLLALRARWYMQRKRVEAAAADLTLATQVRPPYSFFVRTERLLAKVLDGGFQARRKVKLAILSSSTTALLAPVVRATLFARGVHAEVYEGPFGNYRQEILDPSSGLYSFAPQIVVVLTNTRDLELPPEQGEVKSHHFCSELRSLWSCLQQRHPCHVIQVGFEDVSGGAWGALEDSRADGRARLVRAANDALSTALPEGVSFLNVNAIAQVDSLDSPREWHASKQFPGVASLPAFGDAVAAQCCAVLGVSSKVLVLDLDNTVWGGVIGEDGIGGIKVGPPTAEGEAHQELQRYARELKARGILLAVCSKNNHDDAVAPFHDHEAMLLKRDDFVAFRANWEDKASNLRALANELSLGLDSFVFLDDNPFERSWVRSQVPEVVVPEGGSTPWGMLAALKRGMYFETLTLTAEDSERQLSYQVNASLRGAEERGQDSLEGFLSSLNMVSRVERVSAATLQRVTQLINKTNQFNLTNKRYTTEQVRQMSESSDWWCCSFRLSDRFGDHGLIGVMLAERAEESFNLDTWLMSCRVLGRRVEEFMCSQLMRAASDFGVRRIVGRYVPTTKNGMVADLLPRMGFVPSEPTGSYVMNVEGNIPPASPWIQAAS